MKLETAPSQRETIQALIKIYVRLVIAQSIQLSNIVLVNLCSLSRLSSYGSYSLQSLTNLRPLHDSEVPPTQCSMPAIAGTQHQAELVELTGIEPVASWLQTRRSPS